MSASVAVAVVTHNGASWIRDVLTSILRQSVSVDRVVVVDDHSDDATCEIVRSAFGSDVLLTSARQPPTSTSSDTYSRIAANFVQAVRECGPVDLVAVADQDDLWHQDRIARQVETIGASAMLASDGTLVDEGGRALGGTLRSVFPIPAGFASADAGVRMRMALRHSIATGSASLVRPRLLDERGVLDVPAGWLHDRWWSLAACAMDAMTVDDAVVIDYRIRADQVVGLDGGRQRGGRMTRLVGHGRRLRTTMSKVADVHDRLSVVAASDRIRAELTRPRIALTMLGG